MAEHMPSTPYRWESKTEQQPLITSRTHACGVLAMLHALHSTLHIGFLSLPYPFSPAFLVEAKTQVLSNLFSAPHPWSHKAGGQTHSGESSISALASNPLSHSPSTKSMHASGCCSTLVILELNRSELRSPRSLAQGDSLRLWPSVNIRAENCFMLGPRGTGKSDFSPNHGKTVFSFKKK